MTTTEHTITAADGWQLNARLLRGEGEPRALVVAGHAMMVDGRTIFTENRPSLATELAGQGFAVLVPDLRGHGRSGPTVRQGGHWHYADLVADTAAWLELARKLAQGRPILWLGHSLFGHVSLAWFGQHPQEAPAAIVAMAVNVWARRFEPRPLVWLAQRSLMATASGVVRVAGRMPARLLRFGSNDEPAGYWADMARFGRRNRWCAADGTDFHANLAQLPCPLLCVVSEGDRLFTRPDAGIAFVAGMPQVTVLRLGAATTQPDLAGAVPDHMGLVTDTRCQPLWRWLGGWLGQQVDRG